MRSEALTALEVDLFGTSRGGRGLWLKIGRILLLDRSHRGAVILIRLAQHFHQRGRTALSRRLLMRLRREFGCFVQMEAQIGAGLALPHPNGIVIGAGVRLGMRCRVYQQVTLGGARPGDWAHGNYPQVGNDVVIYAGAKLIGPISVGDGARIGANAVVLVDVPAHHQAVGIPARILPIERDPADAAASSALRGVTQHR